MNILVNILTIAFAIFGFTLIGFAYSPIIKKHLSKDTTNLYEDKIQYKKFLKYLSPEIIAKLKSLKADR